MQSLLFNNKYQQPLFAHRFRPRHLGRSTPLHRRQRPRRVRLLHRLQARPHRHAARLPQEASTRTSPRRVTRARPSAACMLDTYRTFGCENSQPTFPLFAARWRQGRLSHQPHRRSMPAARKSPPQLLSEDGFVINVQATTNGDDQEEAYRAKRQFEKRFFSEATNLLFCKTFLENSLRDPDQRRNRQSHRVRGQPAPRSQTCANSQRHGPSHVSRASTTPILRCRSPHRCPARGSMTINFTNNNLLGSANFQRGLQNQQGARLRHRRHDDHRL